MKQTSLLSLLYFSVSSVTAFTSFHATRRPSDRIVIPSSVVARHLVIRHDGTLRDDDDDDDSNNIDHGEDRNIAGRRTFFQSMAGLALVTAASVATTVTATTQSASAADNGNKVLVLGGTGFVGAQVVKSLKDHGATVVATSRDGRGGTMALDVTKASDVAASVEALASGCTAVISCIGSIGTDLDEVVNSATGLAAKGAKTAGAKRFVYITVAPEVVDFAKDIGPLKAYLEGKKSSRASVKALFGDSAVFIEPTFIYGGDSFGLNPPRVASFYGTFIEGLLSSGPVRSIEGIMPPGIVKIALEPPVAVDAVANAAIAGALGKAIPGQALDTHDKINAAATML